MSWRPNPFLLSCEVISAHEYIAIAKYKFVGEYATLYRSTNDPLVGEHYGMLYERVQGYLRMNDDD